MKKVITLIFIVSFILAQGQVSPLLDHVWQLDKIETTTETFTPDPNPDPNTGTFDIIFFQDTGSSHIFEFGVYGSVIGMNLIFDDTNQSFLISDISLLLGESSVAASYFTSNFLYQDQLNDIIYNPFSYQFTYENNLIYLDITNSEGSVATFFVDFLSQDNFLEQNIVLYPNPVQDKLFIKSPNMAIEHVIIYDLSGKMVFEQNDISNDNLDVSHLQSGVYILKIETSVGVVQRKLVKK